MIACSDAFGRGSDSPSAPRTLRTYASSAPPSGRSSVTSIPPSVSVPVLSRQTVSTRASPSMA